MSKPQLITASFKIFIQPDLYEVVFRPGLVMKVTVCQANNPAAKLETFYPDFNLMPTIDNACMFLRCHLQPVQEGDQRNFSEQRKSKSNDKSTID